MSRHHARAPRDKFPNVIQRSLRRNHTLPSLTAKLTPATINVVTLKVFFADLAKYSEIMHCHDYLYEPRTQILNLFAVVNGRMMVVSVISGIARIEEAIDE